MHTVLVAIMAQGVLQQELAELIQEIGSEIDSGPAVTRLLLSISTLEGVECLDELASLADHLVISTQLTNFSVDRHKLLTATQWQECDGLLIVDGDGAYRAKAVTMMLNASSSLRSDVLFAQKPDAYYVNKPMRTVGEKFMDWVVFQRLNLAHRETFQLQSGIRYLSQNAIETLLAQDWNLKNYFWDLQCSYYCLYYSFTHSTVQVPMRELDTDNDASYHRYVTELHYLRSMLNLNKNDIVRLWKRFTAQHDFSDDLYLDFAHKVINDA